MQTQHNLSDELRKLNQSIIIVCVQSLLFGIVFGLAAGWAIWGS